MGKRHLRFSGLETFDSEDVREDVRRRCASTLAKMARQLQGTLWLDLHVKSAHKGGTRSLFELSVRLQYPGGMAASYAEGWDASLTAQQALRDIEGQVRSMRKSGMNRTSTAEVQEVVGQKIFL